MAGKVVNERSALSSFEINLRLRAYLHEFDDIAVRVGDKGDPVARSPLARRPFGMDIYSCQMANCRINIADP